MSKWLTLLCLGVVGGLGYKVYKSHAAGGALDYVSWNYAVESAPSRGKPILLYFGGSW